MTKLNLCRSALFIATSLALISAESVSDGKANLKCEQLSLTSKAPEARIFRFAKKIHNCLELTLDKATLERLQSLKEQLPTSILNAVFSKTVCLKNKRFSEYLYSPDKGFRYDTGKRLIFTWIGADWTHTKGDFRLIPSGKYFFIVNTNSNEYLFAGGSEYLKGAQRQVYTLEPDWDTVNERQAMWQLIPVGDTGRVYIKNRRYGEYFYAAADNLVYDKDHRSIYTWSSDDDGCNMDEHCIWDITATC